MAALIAGVVLFVGIGVGIAVRSMAAAPDVMDAQREPAGGSAPAAAPPAGPASSLGSMAPPRPKATATFDFHGTRQGTGKSFYVLGRVRNTSPAPISKPKVAVVMKDHTGREVGRGFGFATREVLAPGESAPVSAIIQDPPKHRKLEFAVTAHRATYVPRFAEGLHLLPDDPKPSRYSTWEATGTVKNQGRTAAKFVKIEMLGLTADNKILGVFSGDADEPVLDPGETSRYRVLGATFDEPPHHFDFSVSGIVK